MAFSSSSFLPINLFMLWQQLKMTLAYFLTYWSQVKILKSTQCDWYWPLCKYLQRWSLVIYSIKTTLLQVHLVVRICPCVQHEKFEKVLKEKKGKHMQEISYSSKEELFLFNHLLHMHVAQIFCIHFKYYANLVQILCILKQKICTCTLYKKHMHT